MSVYYIFSIRFDSSINNYWYNKYGKRNPRETENIHPTIFNNETKYGKISVKIIPSRQITE